MKKTLLASLGLTLMLSTTAGIAVAEESNPTSNKQLNTTSVLEYDEQEPNDTNEQANYYFIGDNVMGSLGEEKQGKWENSDIFKFDTFEYSNNVHFTVQGSKYPDSYLELTLYDSNGKFIKRSGIGEYFLDSAVEKRKEYYLGVTAIGFYHDRKPFYYKISSSF
ncbi:hypothetical protein D3C74_172850 [compost metagenome]